jgi:hypothetical protein
VHCGARAANAAAEEPRPSTGEQRAEEALRLVTGWAWGMEQIVRATPPDAIARSRIADR